MSGYILGTSDHELARLTFQQQVWREPTEAFLGALAPAVGETVLDLGCGPGLVTVELARRVGPSGRVIAVDEAERWTAHLEGVVERDGLHNVRVVRAQLQQLALEETADAALLRWVLSFLPDPADVLRRATELLRPGGRLGVMDYNHLGVSLFPRSRGFEAVIDGLRGAYRRRGGDAFVMGSILRHFRAAGLEPVRHANHVLSGPPGSPAFEWADRFFPFHVPRLVATGDLDADAAARFADEWAAAKADPDAMFFSPIVVAAVARRGRAER